MMPNSKSESAEIILLLQDIENQSRRNAFEIPHKEESKQFWEGVLFSILGKKFLTALGDVKEILNYPQNVSSVPGAKRWVRGVANVRGSLLPIFDLQQFLGGNQISLSRKTRVLVIEHEGLFAGLMVEDVFGMRHFNTELRINEHSADAPISQYISGAYDVEGVLCPILSMHVLAEDNTFQVVAA
jgi:twitching motility protein PilI